MILWGCYLQLQNTDQEWDPCGRTRKKEDQSLALRLLLRTRRLAQTALLSPYGGTANSSSSFSEISYNYCSGAENLTGEISIKR